jgi:Phage tail tube protein
MPIATTSRAQLRYIPEATFGVTPVSGNAINLRMTGESLSFNLTKESDKEIRSDRQMTSTTTVSAAASGDVKCHFQYAEYDKLLAGTMQNPFTVFGVNGVGATFTADFTATTITASAATSGASIFTNLQRGQYFKLNAPTHGFPRIYHSVSDYYSYYT